MAWKTGTEAIRTSTLRPIDLVIVDLGLPDMDGAEVVERIRATVAAWRGQPEKAGEIYADVPGYCRSVPLAEIARHGHVLTPGRYVGAEEVEDDDEAFADKMQKLTEQLGEQMAKGAELDQLIRQSHIRIA